MVGEIVDYLECCLIVSVKHTRQEAKHITLWKPYDAGYCEALMAAGVYRKETVLQSPGYYNNTESTIAVPYFDLMALSEDSEESYFEGKIKRVIPNTILVWDSISNVRMLRADGNNSPKHFGSKGKITYLEERLAIYKQKVECLMEGQCMRQGESICCDCGMEMVF